MRIVGITAGVVLLLVAAVYFVGPRIYVRYFLTGLNCEPAVSGFSRAEAESPSAAARLAAMFQEDQADRRALGSRLTSEELAAQDTQRRHETLRYISAPALHSAEDIYHAAMIFQHGTCSDHFALAHELAELSMELGHERAKWLYAATLDRYLRSTRQVQRFGTQYDRRGRCRYVLGRVDPSTTDEERRQFDVPTLADARTLADELTARCRRQASDV